MRRGLVTMNLHRRRHTFCLALALCCSIISITSAEDFQFASEKEEEIQPMLAKPVEVVSKAQPIKSIYSKEKTHCPSSQNKIILSLVLRSHSWEEIVEKKRQKAINKLSKFFLVPKENFIIDDVGRADIHEMTSNAIRRGRNSFPGGSSAVGSRKLGRIGFLIGCGKTIFPEEKLIANTVAQQMKEKALDDISGLDFAWWAIWSKQHPTGRHRSQSHSQSQLPRRVKRQQAADGFGNDEEEDDYEDYYDDEDEIEPTEVPQHAHRHHHGDSSSPVHPPPSITSTSTSSSSSPKTSGGGDVGGDKKGSAMAAALPTTDSHSKKGKKLDGHQSAGAKTQTESNDQFDFTQADIRESVSQLESTISKTIENNEELKKEEESLLAKKASKHKKIDIERIVETELMLPDIEQMKSGRDVFRDDYVIEDVAVTPTVKKHFATKTTTRMPMTTLRTLSSSKKSTPSSSATTETTSKFIKSSSTSSRGLTTMMTSWPSTASTSKISKVEPTTTPRSTSATTPETSSINSVVSSSIDDDSSKEDNLSNQGLSPDTKSTPISSTTTRRTATTTEKMTTTPKSTTKKAATTTTEVTTTTTRASTTPPPTTTTTSVATPSTDAAAAAAPTQLEEFKKETVEEVSTISASNNPAVAVGHQGPAITRSSGGSSSPSTVATNQHPPNSKQNYILQPPLLTTIPTDGGASSNINSRQEITTPPTSVSSVSGGAGKSSGKSKEDTYEDNYDDEYDDELEEEATTIAVPTEGRQAPGGGVVVPTTESTTPEPAISSTVPSTSTTPTTPPTTTESTTPSTTTTTTTAAPTTTSTLPTTTELDEPTNLFPIIKNRIPKQAIIAGKVFSLPVPLETFYDNEDGNNLRLDLFDSNGNQLKHSSWIQFNPVTREIYGLPLEKDVSKWHYILQATDSGDKTVNETVDISVQQHKSHRSVNHEISLALRLQQKFTKNVDWQLQVIRGIAKVLGDVTLTNVVVREVRNSIQDPNLATFVYTNETLPKDRCPEEKLDELVAQLTETALNEVLKPDILVKSVQGQQIGQCLKSVIPRVKPTQSTIATKNFAPTTRNQVDRVNATVGHLLVFKVPTDTFYDPEDGEELKLKLLTNERNPLDQFHWLQFDSKNNEFYGIPRSFDVGQKEYLLIAEDREGLTATDALIVVVHQPHHKREQSVLFELTLDTTHEQFTIALAQRRFIERLAQVFGDANTNYIQIKNIRPIHHTGQIQVTFYNTTLYRQHQRCPDEEIEALRNILLYPDGTIRAKVREILGQEFSLQNVSLIPMGTCQGYDTPIHVTNEPEKAQPPPVPKDDYLLTFVLPAVIILAMLLIASLIACVLYRRRLTGKMELEYINFQPIASSQPTNSSQGTDEERKSFRSKGIPVIFQDELDEKPEIGNKSPVILKDEKPPLLPPSYSSTNNDGDNEDVDEYVPPPAVVMGGRESRGKSPVTPSYRRPPPYVSP
ncbi:uncharacterized protein LOC129754770 isoform X3 [Uranotaenia lowii]|uniref:uncharacterized protein LOC129754770 isoform X3 n=1 Tax=Uranotaenia lowii TaxID=190385 RepID=UPI002478D9ED|nr:uncharacterized protein LOC129754770 isoform X3 [Uranotaenia lowii]